MLNVTALELTALAAHYEALIAEGFNNDVIAVKAALSEGDNMISQNDFFALSTVLHTSLERFENDDVEMNLEQYRALNAFAVKLNTFDDDMYTQGIWR